MINRSLHRMHATDLSNYLDCPTDYSETFTKEVATCASDLAKDIHISLVHNSDMNYSSAQSIRMFLSSDRCEPATSMQNSKYELRVLISSKGPLFCILILASDQQSHWRLCKEDSIPVCIANIEDIVIASLLRKQYKIVERDILWKTLPDRFDEMDDAPSTIFSVLFSEIL